MSPFDFPDKQYSADNECVNKIKFILTQVKYSLWPEILFKNKWIEITKALFQDKTLKYCIHFKIFKICCIWYFLRLSSFTH